MSDKRILRTIDCTSVKALLPQDKRLTIAHLCIGSETNYASSIQSVYGAPGGHISGGGTMTTAYQVYDFGFDVENHSAQSMSVQFVFAEVAADGYSVGKRDICVDVSPGEKRRAWSSLHISKESQFRSYVVSEVSVGLTSEAQHGSWTEKTSPNKSLHELFGLEHARILRPAGTPPILRKAVRFFMWVVLCVSLALLLVVGVVYAYLIFTHQQ
jgi:hypothetical protein